MGLEVARRYFESEDGLKVPAYVVKGNGKPVVIVHGYASSKEEMLGLAFRIAERGFYSVAIDLRGHGENENPFDENALADVNGVVTALASEFGQVYAVGFSLGGLLALASKASYVVAASPPLMQSVVPEAKFMLRLNSCRVKEKDKEALFRILEKLNPVKRRNSAFLLYGKGESRGIAAMIEKWANENDGAYSVISSNQAMLPEVEVEPDKLRDYLPHFVSHLAMPHSRESEEVILRELERL